MRRHKSVGGTHVYSSPIKRYAMATPIWANDHLYVLEERDLRLTRHNTFTTMRLGQHHRVVPYDARVTHNIDKNTWAVVAEDGGIWYFGTFDQCRAMLDRIEMHQAKWFMVQGTMAEGFV
jgi:hypothetical protein